MTLFDYHQVGQGRKDALYEQVSCCLEATITIIILITIYHYYYRHYQYYSHHIERHHRQKAFLFDVSYMAGQQRM